MATLHVFHNEANEWVIAVDAADAAGIQQAETGLGPDDPDRNARLISVDVP